MVVGVAYNPTLEVMDSLNCQYYAHGDDIALDENGVSSVQEVADAGRYKEFKRTRGVSTTNIVGKLLLNLKTTIDPDTEHVSEPIQTSQLGERLKKKRDSATSEEEKDTTFQSMGSAKFLATTQRIMVFANHKDP